MRITFIECEIQSLFFQSLVILKLRFFWFDELDWGLVREKKS